MDTSSRPEAFPAGLRVLVVDDDPTWLKILEKMLRKCSYEVTTCGLARVALDMLREKRDRFDIVISDVNMPDMDGFKLLEHVGLEMDLPVIMMSVDGETSRVMKGVQHGACDYLLKPIRMKELKNIWQHVFRKKIHEVKEVESHDGIEEFQLMRNRLNEFDDRLLLSGSELNFSKKRKDLANKEFSEQDFLDASSVKKARVVWSVDLHQKFVNAVNQIGFDKVGPKKILDLMNVPGLTRENVASHLQKYRLYLSRLQKDHEGLACDGGMQSDSLCKDDAGSFFLQSSTAMHNTSDFLRYSSERPHYNDVVAETKDHSDYVPVKEEIKNDISNSDTESTKAKIISPLGTLNSPSERECNVELKPKECAISNLNIWNRGPEFHLVQSHAQQQDLFSLISGYRCKQQLEDIDIISSCALPMNSSVITTRWDEVGSLWPADIDCGGKLTSNTQDPCFKINSFDNQNEAGARGFDSFLTKRINLGAKMGSIGLASAKRSHPDQYLFDLIEASSQTSNLTEEPTASSSPDNAQCSLEGYGYLEKVGLDSFKSLQFDSLTHADISGNSSDGLQFDCDYAFDMMEYPTMDGGLLT